MADMNETVIPAPVLVALKRSLPDATDAMLAGAWQQATTANPSLKQTDPMVAAQRIASAFGSTKTVPAASAPTDVPVPQYDPFRGTGYTQTDLLKQYDPAIINARKAAMDEEFNRKAAALEAQMPANKASAFFGAQANPTGTAVADLQRQMKEQRDLGLERQKQLYEIEKQQQTGATAGGALGGEFLGKEKTKQEIAQAAQTTATGGLSLKNQQDLNRSDSPQTLLARQLLIDQFRASGIQVPAGLENATAVQLMGSLDPKVLDAYKKKVGIVGEAAEAQIKAGLAEKIAPLPAGAPEIGQPGAAPAAAPTIAPAAPTPAAAASTAGVAGVAGVPKSPTIKVISGVRSTAKQQAMWDESVAAGRTGRTASGNPIAKPGTSAHETGNGLDLDNKLLTKQDRIALAAAGWFQPLPAKDPNHWERASAVGSTGVVAPTVPVGPPVVEAIRQSNKPQLQMPPGSNMTISAGGVTLAPSPAVTGGQAAAATEDAVNREQSKVSTQFGMDALTRQLAKQSADAVAAGKFSATGNVANWMAKSSPGDSEKIRTSLYKLADARAAYARASGNPIVDREAEVDRIMKLSPGAFQNELLNLNEQVGRNENRATAFSKHIASGGTATNFVDPSRGKVYLYNPKTGESGFASADKVASLTAKGWTQLNQLGR